MLYLRESFFKASPKAISERTSYLRVRLEFLRYPHLIRYHFNGSRFGPPWSFTSTSTWTWIGHPVSGRVQLTITLWRALGACKHKVSGSLSLPSRGAFHLSFTVLFSIGHQVVFRLGGWSPLIPTGFHVSGGTLDTACVLCISNTGLSPSSVGLPIPFFYTLHCVLLSEPRYYF